MICAFQDRSVSGLIHPAKNCLYVYLTENVVMMTTKEILPLMIITASIYCNSRNYQ